ncbi:SusC/RagA family TonB-linked outer membrane protein [Ferruginibacter albus]|uniref:SusC/RagA family TonB-linked outer membrane protein n=1 Tax=Ferruginibacter albus TaxID=2875540 RepID=UPI001CC5F527|nr:TonB-dependent receptor [Ferruginibacter albus]UAY53625.1 TonB-dependent receptor [Ferruginibacter albus]
MKFILTSFFCIPLFFLLLLSSNSYAQQISIFNISGKVIDEQSGKALGDVTIQVSGKNKTTVTDSNGLFSITAVNKEYTLIFSHISYQTKKILLKKKAFLTIVMAKKNTVLNDIVVLGYSTQLKNLVTGSTVTLKNKDITRAPIASTVNTLQGITPGLTSIQTSGMPGSDKASINIRGFGDPLIIVDGVQMSFNNIDVNQIESISILKDASASIYGARGGNGIIVVTTKRGQNQKPVIALNSSVTLQGVTKILKPPSSGELATMRLEQYLQSGQSGSAPFTQADIDKYFSGNDPAYPNTDWYNSLFRNDAPQTNNAISINGGNDRTKFFGLLAYTDQKTMIKTNGGQYQRYNAQSNVDTKIADNLLFSLDFAAIFEDSYFPVRGLQNGGSFWNDYYLTQPWYPVSLPDASKISYGGITTGSLAAVSNTSIAGYNKSENQFLKGAVTLNYAIKPIKGLKAKAMINYNSYTVYTKRFNKPYVFYTYNPNSKVYTQTGSFSQSSVAEGYYKNADITQQYSFTYERTFKDHYLNILALIESIDIDSTNFQASRINLLTPLIDQLFVGSANGQNTYGSANENGRFSYVGRINYRYKNKYLLEVIFRADASAKFSSQNRWGYFPGATAGWILSKERFMNTISWIDNLKLRFSYGRSGNDNVGNFQYLSNYVPGGNIVLNGASLSGIYLTNLANPLLTWEEIEIYNAGIDLELHDRIVYGSIDIFKRNRHGIPATRVISFPSTFGATLPQENLNSLTDRGFELLIGASKTYKDISFDISANISWSRAKWTQYDEPLYTDANEKNVYQKTGQWTDKVMGYVSDGLFTSKEQINTLPYKYYGLSSNTQLNPGDIIYKDLNGDAILNWKDQREIGQGVMPHWMYGIITKINYKQLDIYCLWQGAWGYSTLINLTQFPNEKEYELRWNQTTNNANALIPRLGGAATNDYISDYNYKNTSYIRLKTISIGYQLPEKLLQKIKMQAARLYVAGINLLTFSTLDKYGVDPEIQSGSISVYPQQRTISVGLNLSF